MGKVIMSASGKGGTGKTTFAANLGAALALKGKLTVLVDMDMGLRNLDVALGLESSIVYDVSDVLDGSCSLDEALIKDSRYENLYFIPSPQTKDASSVSEDEMKKLWKRLSERFDYCIADAPAGLDGGFKLALSGADEAVIVTVPETAALRDADRAISVIEDSGVEEIKLVLNKVRPDMIERGIMMNIDDCMDILQIPMLGIVCDDEQLTVSSLKGEMAVSNPESTAGRAFLNIAERILGNDVPIMNMEIKKKGFWERLRFLLGK